MPASMSAFLDALLGSSASNKVEMRGLVRDQLVCFLQEIPTQNKIGSKSILIPSSVAWLSCAVKATLPLPFLWQAAEGASRAWGRAAGSTAAILMQTKSRAGRASCHNARIQKRRRLCGRSFIGECGLYLYLGFRPWKIYRREG